MLKKYSQFWGSILLLIDILIIAAAWMSACYLRVSISWIPADNGAHSLRDYFIILIPILLIWPFVFRNLGLYRPRRTSSNLSETLDIAKASSLALIILISVTFFAKKQEFPRLIFLYFWGISIIALSFERWGFRELLRTIRRKGYNTRRVLIVGAGDLGGKVVKKIKGNKWTGLEVAGYLDDYKFVGVFIEGEKVLGRINDIETIVDKYGVDQVFITLPIRAYKRVIYIVEKLSDKLVSVRVVPDIYQAITLNANVEDFEGFPIINLTDTPIYGWNMVLKRFADIVFSSLALILNAPLMVFIALIIKTTSPGPVFFKQRRYGIDGKVIWIYKFRTMTVCEDGSDVPQAQKCDLRITPFGAFLRRTSLDELPQFINVLQGQMSVVGPRPHAIAHNEQYRKLVKSYMLRHKVKPGITGWAQVNGWRGETDTLDKMENRVRHDLFYIENWSTWFDIKIMWLTLWKGFVNKNAY